MNNRGMERNPESLVLHGPPQHIAMHGKCDSSLRIPVLPHSSLTCKSFSPGIPICEVITWSELWGLKGPLPSEFSIYNSIQTSISFLRG